MNSNNEVVVTENKKEKAFASISIKSFIMIAGLLVLFVILAGVLSYFIPQGSFVRDESGAIIPGTFVKGQVDGIAFWRVFTAPFRVFFSEDGLTVFMICLFLLVMSGVFNILEKTGGIKIFICRLVQRFANKKTVGRLVEATMEKYKTLNSHLSEIKRKSDYRNTHEKWTDEEKSAWKKAVQIFNAYPGIRP